MSYGEPNSDQLTMENGRLVLTYTGGVACVVGQMKTVIVLLCDPGAKVCTQVLWRVVSVT